MANNWAIVIGINYYQRHAERRLKYAVRDAQLFQSFLCDQAHFEQDHVITCLGSEEYRDDPNYPTYSNLLGLLTQDLQPRRIGNVNRFWFFFAGHGISRKLSSTSRFISNLFSTIECFFHDPLPGTTNSSLQIEYSLPWDRSSSPTQTFLPLCESPL